MTPGRDPDARRTHPSTYVGEVPIDRSAGEVTRILEALGRGERQATGELLPLVYNELRRLAAKQLARESPGQTLQATALVHEARGDGNRPGHYGLPCPPEVDLRPGLASRRPRSLTLFRGRLSASAP